MSRTAWFVGLSGVIACSGGEGGGGGEAEGGGEEESEGYVATTCFDVGFEDGAVFPISDRTVLTGLTWQTCEGTYDVRVSIDGNLLHPADDIEGGYRVEGVAGEVGRWSFGTDLWCYEDEQGPLQGEHEVTVESLDATGAVVHAHTETVRFSGAIGEESVVPWTPGLDSRGSEPGNLSLGIEVRQHFVPVLLGSETVEYGYVVELPTGYDPATPAATVLSLTGWGSDDWYTSFSYMQDWREDLDTRGWIHLVPDGNWFEPERSQYGQQGAVGAYGCMMSQCSPEENWYTPVLTAVLQDFIARYSVETDQVYVSGFSCGASYAYCLGENFPEKFAASAIMDGNQDPIWPAAQPDTGNRRIPMYIVGGAAGPDWEETLAPGAPEAEAYCLDTEFHQAGTDHTWYPEYNQDILAFFGDHRIE